MQFLSLSERCAVIELGPNLCLRVWMERGRAIAQFVEDDARGVAAISVPYTPSPPPPAPTPAPDHRAPTRRLVPPPLPSQR